MLSKRDITLDFLGEKTFTPSIVVVIFNVLITRAQWGTPMIRLLLVFVSILVPVYAQADDVNSAVKKNKQLVLSVFDALESGDLALLNRVFDPEGRSVIGSIERKRGGPFNTFAEAAPFPAALDNRKVIVEAIFAESNKVAIQSRICGNHARELVGYQPTEKKLCARYTNLYTIKAGRIVENVVGFDPEVRKTLEKHKSSKLNE